MSKLKSRRSTNVVHPIEVLTSYESRIVTRLEKPSAGGGRVSYWEGISKVNEIRVLRVGMKKTKNK